MARTSNYENEWSYFGIDKQHATRTYNGSGDATINFGYSDYYGRTPRYTRITYDADIFQGNTSITQPAHNAFATASDSDLGTSLSPKAIPAAGATGYLLLETNKDFTTTALTFTYALTYGTTIQVTSASAKSYSDSLLQNLNGTTGVADTSITLGTCAADYGKDQKFTIKADTKIICPAYLKSGIHEEVNFKQGNTLLGTADLYITNSTKTLSGSAGTIVTEATTGSFTVTSNCISTSLAYEGLPADGTNGNVPSWDITLSRTLLNDDTNRFTTSAQNVNVTTDYYYGNEDRNIKITATTPNESPVNLGNLITQKAHNKYVEFDSIRIGGKTSAGLVEGSQHTGDSYFPIWASFITNQDPTETSSYFKLRCFDTTYFEFETSASAHTISFDTSGGTTFYNQQPDIITDPSYINFSTTAADKNYGANTYYRVWLPCYVKPVNSTYYRLDFAMYYGSTLIHDTYCYFKTASAFNIFTPTLTTTGGQSDVTVTTNVDDWTATLDQES